jgi:hypothetical protein
MPAEWTGKPPDPSLGPPQPRHVSTLKDYAEAIMLTLAAAKETQVRLELHGKVLILSELGSHQVYAIGTIDNAD